MITIKHLVAFLVLAVAIVLAFITLRKPDPAYSWWAVLTAAIFDVAVYLFNY